jgi:tyrosyl-tRNA synthetase
MSCPTYSTEKKAAVLVDASFVADREAAADHGVHRSTIVRWRAKMDEDPELAEAYAKMYREEVKGQDWLQDATETVQQAFSFLRRAADELDAGDPEAVKAVAMAVQTVTEAKLTAEVINARLAEQNTQQQSAAGENAPRLPRERQN